MSSLVEVDGVAYDVLVRQGEISREASILDGKNAGRLKSGNMELDTIGTFYNYGVTFLYNKLTKNFVAYDSLYEVLTDPVNRNHTIKMPYAQSSITFTAYVGNVKDVLKKQKSGANYWDEMQVNFVAIKPYRRS